MTVFLLAQNRPRCCEICSIMRDLPESEVKLAAHSWLTPAAPDPDSPKI